jgi:2-oxoglutarate/2-oxoacid ferredoxin oxidoreductase subunit alpha
LNLGQLRMLLRARFLIDAHGINKVRGQPFTIAELVRGVREILDGASAEDESLESVTPDIQSGG